MTIQEALKTEGKIRRKPWVNQEFHHFHELTIDELDILADDWEAEDVEPEVIETSLLFKNDNSSSYHSLVFDKTEDGIELEVEEASYFINYALSEKDIDKLLDFLYNNTKVGKSRVIPF